MGSLQYSYDNSFVLAGSRADTYFGLNNGRIGVKIMWILLILIGILTYFFVIRNTQVFIYLQRVSDKVYHKNLEDIEAHRTDKLFQRWEETFALNYDEMMFKFWRTFDSHLEDKPLLKELMNEKVHD